MRRKLIKQGGTGLTLYIPKKWIDSHKLQAGDEIEIEESEESLVLSSQNRVKPVAEIALTIPQIRESVTRTIIVNAYRAGYDRLLVTYPGSVQDINTIVTNNLIGFEVFKKKETLCSIESVAEPNYNNFENIIEKQFFMILEIIRTIGGDGVSEFTSKIQRYDNFLKRSISKNILAPKAMPFLWQFLSNLTQIARQCYHFHHTLTTSKKRMTTKEKKYLVEVEQMFNILHKAYLAKNRALLYSLHDLDQKIVREKGMKLLLTENPLIMYHLISVARLIYLTNSSLEGYLQESEFQRFISSRT